MKTADLCDEFHEQLSICEVEFRSFGKKKSFYGPIRTVRCLDDNVLVKQALETIEAGEVLVVDGTASRKVALMGDKLARIAENRRLAGVIIYGCIRDSKDINEMNVGVFALGTCPLKSMKLGEGNRDEVLAFGGIKWKPGHFVYCDEDGVIVSPEPLVYLEK